MTKHLHSKLALMVFACSLSQVAASDFTPITLTSEGLNFDIVVERGATPPPPPLTTASMDGGVANTGNSWYEQGANVDAPATGLPAAGTTLTSETLSDHSFALPASYTNNNAILIDSTLTNATLTLSTPAAFPALSFLTASGHGPMTVAITVHHANGSAETNSFISVDWFGGTDIALTANGRIDVVSRAFNDVDSGNPRLYSTDVTLADTTSPVTSIDFAYSGGGGAAAIFAVSGGSDAGFTPITVTGYNQDIVAEANAAGPTALNATTASMDAGVANTGATWYEQGYNAAAPLTGLPAAGSTLTNEASTDHRFTLPASYTTNNAVIIDADNPSATLSLATGASYSALSFLTAAGSGAVTIDFTITHANGSTQTGSFISPDWFNSTPIAFTGNGRVNVDTGVLDAVNTGNPRLYAVDVAVNDSSAAINSITLNYASGSGHAAIFAVSGASGGVKPILDTQPTSVNVTVGSTGQFSAAASGTPPLQFQWQHEVNGTFSNVANTGSITGATSTNLTISNVALADAGQYQLVVSNAVGSTTSQPAVLNVLSSATDVTAPGDPVVSVGGTSPGAEAVENAIDNTTAKYLNFGTDNDQNPPFVGPAGLEVTPSMGSTVVTGLRIYTANDVPDRDPTDYRLEGASDGSTNFTLIASGSLALPEARNATGLDIDPTTQPNQEVVFQNTTGYTTYRLTFTNVKNNTAANSVQIAEVELLGTAGQGVPSVSLLVARDAAGSITLTPSQAGTLQSTTALNGASTVWQDEGPINGPITITPSGTQKFYRLQSTAQP